VRRLLAKARLLLSNHEIGNPEPTRFFADRFAPIVRWLSLGFGFTLALAVVGILASWRGGSHRFLLWGFLLLHAATTVLFLVGARYRAPMMPVLLLYAANGIIALSVAALARRWIPFAAGSATALLVYAASVSVPVDRQASTANGLSWLAVAAGRDGLTDEASALFRESIALAPSSCEAHRGLGVLLFQTDRREEALGELRLAVALCPESVGDFSDKGLETGIVTMGKSTRGAGGLAVAIGECHAEAMRVLDHPLLSRLCGVVLGGSTLEVARQRALLERRRVSLNKRGRHHECDFCGAEVETKVWRWPRAGEPGYGNGAPYDDDRCQ
jgi:tetratricopeptide (TPR) repeat protein